MEQHKAQFKELYHKTRTFYGQDLQTCSEALLDHLKEVNESYSTLEDACPFPANEAHMHWAGSVLVSSGALSFVSDILVATLPDVTSAMREPGKQQKERNQQSVHVKIGKYTIYILVGFAYWSQQVCEAVLEHPTLVQRVVSTLDEWAVQRLSGKVNDEDFAKWLLWIMRNISVHDSCTEALRGVPDVVDMLQKYTTARTVSHYARGASMVTLAAIAREGELHLVMTSQSLVQSVVNDLSNTLQGEEATKWGFLFRLKGIRALCKNKANAEHVVACGGLQTLKMVLEICKTDRERQVCLDVLLKLSAVAKIRKTMANDVDLMTAVITSYEDSVSSSDVIREKARQVLKNLLHRLRNSPDLRVEGILASLEQTGNWESFFEILVLDDWRRIDTNWRPITGEDETDGWTSLHLACYYNRFHDVDKYVKTGEPEQETSQAGAIQDATSSEQTSVNATSSEQTSVNATSSEQASVNATSPTEETSVNATSSEQKSVNATSSEHTSVNATSSEQTSVNATSSKQTSVNATSSEQTSVNATSPTDQTSQSEASTSKNTTSLHSSDSPNSVEGKSDQTPNQPEALEKLKMIKFEYPPSNINTQTEDGETPLLVACQQGNARVVRKLLQYKDLIDVNLADNQGKTPLFVACEQGNVLVVQMLLQYKDRIDVDRAVYRAMGIAKERGHLQVVKALLLFMTDANNEQLKNTTLAES